MKISIHRNPGLYGYIIDLAVIFNGVKICDIKRNETKELVLPDVAGILEVKMEPSVFSKPLALTPSDNGASFICGVRWWAAFDPIGLNLLSPKTFPVFYLHRDVSS